MLHWCARLRLFHASPLGLVQFMACFTGETTPGACLQAPHHGAEATSMRTSCAKGGDSPKCLDRCRQSKEQKHCEGFGTSRSAGAFAAFKTGCTCTGVG